MKWCIQSGETSVVSPLNMGPIPSCRKLWQPLQCCSKTVSPEAMVKESDEIALASAELSDPHRLNKQTTIDAPSAAISFLVLFIVSTIQYKSQILQYLFVDRFTEYNLP